MFSSFHVKYYSQRDRYKEQIWTDPLALPDLSYPSEIFWWFQHPTYLGRAYGRVFISWELCDVWKITAPLMVFEGCDNWLYDGAAIIIEQTLLAGRSSGGGENYTE